MRILSILFEWFEMNEQQSLFTMPAAVTVSPLAKRDKARDAAIRKAGEPFREAFEAFVISYLASRGPATAEQIRIAYEGTPMPKPPSKRASGAVYTKLRREGTIREIGRQRSAIYGNFLPVIELVRFRA